MSDIKQTCIVFNFCMDNPRRSFGIANDPLWPVLTCSNLSVNN